MELQWHCTRAIGMKQKSCWGGFLVFQKATREPDGKAKKPTAKHLMPHNKHSGYQGCKCQFYDHNIFNTSVFHVQLHQFSIVISCQFIFCYLPVICLFASCFFLAFFILPIISNSLLFCLLCFLHLFVIYRQIQ
jgi:hypothetical protein